MDKLRNYKEAEVNLCLNEEDLKLLDGHYGEVKKRIMETIVLFAKLNRAEKLVEIEGPAHFSIGDCTPGLGPDISVLRLLKEAGVRAKYDFTVDPSAPTDVENLFVNSTQIKQIEDAYKHQKEYDELMLDMGLESLKACTCTSYMKEIGNIPKQRTILAWSESSCVVYANSVLGARTNRNGAGMDLFLNIIGKAPYYGLLTDEGRKADFLVEICTTTRPDPQLLGALIGIEAGEDVPYIIGLDTYFKNDDSVDMLDYLKDMGAACAAIGAVGLYHVENITPEAQLQGRKLLKIEHKVLTITDQSLLKLREGYQNLWEDKNGKPEKCLIGCPHLSIKELNNWVDNLWERLRKKGKSKLNVPTIFFAAPAIIEKFRKDENRTKLLQKMGAKISATCPEAMLNIESLSTERVITNSNKLRDVSKARFFELEELVDLLVEDK